MWPSILVLSGRLSSFPSIPSAPANFFKHHVPVHTTLLAVTATTLQSSDYQSSCFRGRNAREAWDGGSQIAHDVTDSEGTVFEEDAGEVVLSKHTRSDRSSRVQVIQFAKTAGCKTALRGVLRVGVLDSFFKIDFRVDMGRSGRSQRSSRSATLVGLGRKGRRERIGGSRKTGVLLLNRQRSRGDSGEAVLAGPEVVAWFDDIDGLRHSSQGQSDARVGIGTGRSHIVTVFGGGCISAR